MKGICICPTDLKPEPLMVYLDKSDQSEGEQGIGPINRYQYKAFTKKKIEK
jgi:hypothetical protein